jgi:hypothetical protein
VKIPIEDFDLPPPTLGPRSRFTGGGQVCGGHFPRAAAEAIKELLAGRGETFTKRGKLMAHFWDGDMWDLSS